MTQLILIRHGETEWNVAEIFRGRSEIGLNENGIKQAELLTKYLNEFKLDAIYSSPLKRALKTAEIIGSLTLTAAHQFLGSAILIFKAENCLRSVSVDTENDGKPHFFGHVM